MFKKTIAAAIIGGAITAAIAGAGTANAFTGAETDFLDLQASHGLRVWDRPADYLGTAHWVCNRLNSVTGDVVVPELMASNPGHSYYQESVFLFDSVSALCPWHDHTGGGRLYA